MAGWIYGWVNGSEVEFASSWMCAWMDGSTTDWVNGLLDGRVLG